MKVSIIFLSYNHELFVAEALRSALQQDYPKYELVVHDDGSTDGTLPIIKEILKNETPSNVEVIFASDGKNHGMVESFNRATAAASGDIIMHISGDDRAFLHRLRRHVEVYQSNLSVMLVLSEVRRIDERGEDIPYKKFSTHDGLFSYAQNKKNIHAGSYILGASASYRAEVFKKFGKILPGGSHSEDNTYWVRALLLGQIYFIAESLLFYRLHTNNESENPWKWRLGLSEKLKLEHLSFAKKHSQNFSQWSIDIAHAKKNGYVSELDAKIILRTARLNALNWEVLYHSLNVSPWGQWWDSARGLILLGEVKMFIRRLKFRFSATRRDRYWMAYEKWMKTLFND